jgi:hypothetical protein
LDDSYDDADCQHYEEDRRDGEESTRAAVGAALARQTEGLTANAAATELT